jgi:HEAT repeat protein
MDAEFGYVLAGPASVSIRNGMGGGMSGYWPRVWALRALLYAWDESAAPAVIDCLADEPWRVREMAAKVVARRRVGDALDEVAALQGDPVARVRAAAHRAIVALVEHDA